MSPATASVEDLLGLAVRLVNAGQRERARLVCEQAMATHAPHPAVQQLLALIRLQEGDAATASELAAASLVLRPDHPPTLVVAGDAARASGALLQAAAHYEHALRLQPERADLWFQLSLVRHDLRDLAGAALALRRVLQLSPERVEAVLNLGIVLQDSGEIDEAMRAYGRAYRMHEASFGRIAHALAAANVGRLWLNLDDLRAALLAEPA